MLYADIAEIGDPDLHGVACDILILPDAEGNMSIPCARPNRVICETHVISDGVITRQTLQDLKHDFVVLSVSGQVDSVDRIPYSIGLMLSNDAVAYFGRPPFTANFDQAVINTVYPLDQSYLGTHVYSRDMFTDIACGINRFTNKVIYSSKKMTSDPLVRAKCNFSVELPSVTCDVIIPFFNNLEFLKKAVQSIQNQKNAVCTIHIVDDGSTVPTETILARLKAPNVKIYRNTHNIGQFMSVNSVIEHCTSDFIAVQDADDISNSDRIWQSVNALQLTGYDVFGCQVVQFADPVNPGQLIDLRSVKPPYWDKRELCFHNIVHGTMVVRKSAFLSLGGYTDFGNVNSNKCGNDTDFIFRAYFAGKKFYIGQRRLLRVRAHSTSCTNSPETKHGSIAREHTVKEIRKRADAMHYQNIDPSMFGALCSGFENYTRLISE